VEKTMMRWILLGVVTVGLGGIITAAAFRSDAGNMVAGDDAIQRGRYLVTIGGCNDCHTPGYMAASGDVPEERWLIGDSLGFRGPWGTTYPGNLRHLLGTMDEDTWVRYARAIKTRPPMPWFNLRVMVDNDLRAIHRYIRSLPADDTTVPDYVPPDRRPTTPHIVMVPQPPEQPPRR
jgi:mono/diheme cytochrome c family protein